MASFLNASSGFYVVTKNKTELQQFSKSSSSTRKILNPRDTNHDSFIDYVSGEMVKLEEFVPDMKNNFPRWSQMYGSKVNQIKQDLELGEDESKRDAISTLDLLSSYANALQFYMDFRQQDAIDIMEKYTGFTEDVTKATAHETTIKQMMESLLKKLKQLTPSKNPLLENLMTILRDTFQSKPNSRAIIFVPSRLHAFSMHEWIYSRVGISGLKPGVITGRLGMSQEEQEIVVDNFRAGETNLMIATSVAEEGLDIPECNLVIRYQYVSTEIGQVQAEGRARAEDSQRITIFSSDAKNKYKELKNRELVLLVEEVLENGYLPFGEQLKVELEIIQQEIISTRCRRVAMKDKQRQSHTSEEIKLICKRCKQFACYGSDIYLEGPHRTVPVPEFQNKFSKKQHHTPDDLIPGSVSKMHKIYCIKCGQDWGIECRWKSNGDVFPVIKCVAFTFEIGGFKRFVKKWRDAPFEMKSLKDWYMI